MELFVIVINWLGMIEYMIEFNSYFLWVECMVEVLDGFFKGYLWVELLIIDLKLLMCYVVVNLEEVKWKGKVVRLDMVVNYV